MGMNQPPQQPPETSSPGSNQPSNGQGVSTDPSALQFMIQNGDVHGLEQQMSDEQEQQDNPMEEQQEPPDPIISYDEAIDAVLKLIVTTTQRDLDVDIQSKAISQLSSAVKSLQEASIPQVDPQAQMELQYQQQESQNVQNQQQMTMQQQLHEQALQHKQQLHEQTLKHNDLNQALKEWQAQQQQNQSADMHDMTTMQNMQNMGQSQEKHQADLQNMQMAQENNQQKLSNENSSK
jgi:hypothetical protein